MYVHMYIQIRPPEPRAPGAQQPRDPRGPSPGAPALIFKSRIISGRAPWAPGAASRPGEEGGAANGKGVGKRWGGRGTFFVHFVTE